MVLICVFCVGLSGCAHIDTDKIEDYGSFLQTMKDMNSGEYPYLPSAEYLDCMEEVVLYYSDYDLLDSFYTIYVNCVYTPEDYKKEEQRLLELSENGSLSYDADSFCHEAIVLSKTFESDEELSVMVYDYFLFDQDASRIVYVSLFDKELRRRHYNIPSEFLPSELVSFMEQKADEYFIR